MGLRTVSALWVMALQITGCAAPILDAPGGERIRERSFLPLVAPQPRVGHASEAFDIAALKLARVGAGSPTETLSSGFLVADDGTTTLLDQDTVVLRLLQHVLTSQHTRYSREGYGGPDGERAGVVLVQADASPELVQALAELGVDVRAPEATSRSAIPLERSGPDEVGLELGVAVGPAQPGPFMEPRVTDVLAILLWTDRGDGGGIGSTTHFYNVWPGRRGVVVWYSGAVSA